MSSIYNNVCPADCHASCRLKTHVENGKIIKIEGDPGDMYSRGSICAKGYTLLERVYSTDRVLYPMKQKEKGTNSWERISWEQALTEIAEVLISIQQEKGSLLPVCLDSYLGTIGVLRLSVEGFFNSIGYITKMVGSPCEAAGSDALALSYGACKKPVPEDMLNSRLIIIWGCNPAWTATHQMSYVFEARGKGAKIVVIDPVFTATAARSDLYIQINPGTDGDLALALGRILLDEGLLDQDFLANYTQGWPEFRSLLETLILDDLATTTGVPLSGIRELAQLYGTHKPATIWLGFGGQRNPTGGQNYRIINALAAMTGNIGVAGGNVHYMTYDAWDFTGEFARLGPPARSEIARNSVNDCGQHRSIGTGRFAELGALNPAIQLLWVAGRNPVSQDQDSSKVKQILAKIPTVVVVDQFMTQTAQYADYFLPVTTPFEFEDIVISFWHYGAAVNEKAIKPLGECKSDFQIVRELAKTLNKIVPGFSTFPVQREASYWLDLEMQRLYPLLNVKHYRELALQYRRINLPQVAWEDKVFLTPSGKYEFCPVSTKTEEISLILESDKEGSSSSPYPFRLLSVRSFALLNSQYRNSIRLQSMIKTSLVLINPEVGRQKMITHGDRVKLYNQLGEICLEACLTPSIPPDLVVVYVGAGACGEEVNTLVTFSETDLGGIVMGAKGLTFNHNAVNLFKVPG